MFAVLMIQPQLAPKRKDVYNFYLVTYSTKFNLLLPELLIDSVMPIQPGNTSNVEETSYSTAGFAFHKMFKSVARFVNSAIKQNPRESRNRLYSLEGLKLCNVTGMIQ